MSKKNHTHKLRRLTYKTGNSVYFCTLPDCYFKIATKLSLGKKSICHRCGSEFVMNDYSIRLAKPHCDKCHKSKHTDESVNESLDINISPATNVTLQEVLANKEIKLAEIEEIESSPDAVKVEDSLLSRLHKITIPGQYINPSLAAKPDDEEI